MSRRIERAREKEDEPLRHKTDGENDEKGRRQARRIPIKRTGAENNAHDMRTQDGNKPESDE